MNNYYTHVSKLRYALRQHFNKKLVFASALVTFICLGVFVGYWLPVNSKVDAIDEQINKIRTDISRSMKLTETAIRYKKTAKNVALIEKRLNSDSRQATIIDSLNRLAKRYRVHIIDEAYEEGRGKEHYQPLNHDLTIEGSYLAIRNFLHAIDGLSTWTVIIESKMSLRSNDSRLVIASLRLATYRKI